MKDIFARTAPQIVFHLAAQPLVRLSYEQPVETYRTNVMGTVHVLEAVRATDSVRTAVMITTDKCYENKESLRGYREDDPFGGYDPYSSSKGACEIAIQSWRRSFFNPADYGTKHHVGLASARAGNVIGGGDWSADRIVPDCIRALEAGRPIELRNPLSVRPWQHVLEPLGGYLLLARRLWEDPAAYGEGWNFGPDPDAVSTVRDVADAMVRSYGWGEVREAPVSGSRHEAGLLTLDISKAGSRLGWRPCLNVEQSVALTAAWYKHYRTEPVYDLCVRQIAAYSEAVSWK